ncbi:MAG: S49 family peptidase, partial [Pseudomonadota bacterium]
MTATADLILERRQMRRRLALWRILAILAFFGAIITAIAVFGGLRGIGSKPSGAHVAVVEISGLITSDRERHEMLEGLAEDDDARAVILRINSPGGTVTGSEELYGDIRAIAEAGKPVVAQMIDAAASGGYIAAIAADHIVARSNTLTASIGVVAEGPNIAGLLADNGISVIRIKPEATPLKAEPGFLTEPAPGAIA